MSLRAPGRHAATFVFVTVLIDMAGFGLITAIVQGGLTGPAVKWLGERRTVVLGLAVAAFSALGYGLAPGLSAVLVLMILHAPEGFVQPALTAIMSEEAPADAQGELRGGIASLLIFLPLRRKR